MNQPDDASADRVPASSGEAKRPMPGRTAAPAVRPEMVARGRVLAADPAYPSLATLRQVGLLIVESSGRKTDLHRD